MFGIYENGALVAKIVVPLTIRSNHPTTVSDTLSLKRFVSRRSAQRWEIETNVEPLSTSAQDLMVSLVTKGYSETVQVLIPQNYGVIKARRVESCLATATVNSNQITISSHSGYMPKGTFIRFENHSKVYMTTTDLNSNGSVGIYPNLKVELINTLVNNGNNVFMNCLYDTDTVRGMIYSDGILMDNGTIKLIEQL
jgi:hypothetical protein